MTDLKDAVTRLLSARSGHFALESGHHGDLWLELELLCLRPRAVRAVAAELAARLGEHRVEAVCGPLVEGAFVASMVAEAMGVPFTYAEGRPDPEAKGLFPVRYAVPSALRSRLKGLRVAVVNDVINAGSAVRGTVTDLETCGAQVVVIASLAVLGPAAARFAEAKRVPLLTLATLTNEIWPPAGCPLCARQIPLDAPRT